MEELKNKNIFPAIIVTAPDAPSGRNLILSSSPAKIWAQKNKIPVLEVASFKEIPLILTESDWDFFVVAAYNFIIPKQILDIPKHGTLNIHPSLLPKLRGPSPIRSAILLDLKDVVGVSVILLDEKVDHGPIISQKRVQPPIWPVRGRVLDEILFREGGRLLAEIIPSWLKGEIVAKKQDEAEVTFSKKFKKSDGLIDLNDNPYKNYLKFCAFDIWPRIYFIKNNKRVIITDAEFKNKEFIIKKVLPEGKKEISYKDFLKTNTWM